MESNRIMCHSKNTLTNQSCSKKANDYDLLLILPSIIGIKQLLMENNAACHHSLTADLKSLPMLSNVLPCIDNLHLPVLIRTTVIAVIVGGVISFMSLCLQIIIYVYI